MKGVVVAPQPAAVEVGAAVLEGGGSAFDAAIATGYMQMVTDPFMCGLGGWGAATLYDATTDRFEHIGFWPRIGALMTPDMWVDDIEGYTEIWRFALFADRRNMIGYGSIMTPGTVAGFDEIHRRFATRPMSELLGPAIELSRGGFPMPEYVANRGHQPSLPGMPHPRDKYAATPAARALFHNADGELKRTGEHYVNPDQAATMERIATHGAEISIEERWRTRSSPIWRRTARSSRVTISPTTARRSSRRCVCSTGTSRCTHRRCREVDFSRCRR
jgi:gamma-glutamyltranspeptidase / glutathione hydrolase